MLVSSSFSRSLLIALVMASILPSKTYTKNDDWIVPAVAGAVGGALISTACVTWYKNSEINDIDYRPFTLLQEMENGVNSIYGKLLHKTVDYGSNFDDYSHLKQDIRKQLPYEDFISSLEKYKNEIKRARKQLKNQIKYWDKRLSSRYQEAKKLLVTSKITYKRICALLAIAKEMVPLLQLEQAIFDVEHDIWLYYDELATGYTNIYQATAAWHSYENNYAQFIIALSYRSGNQYPLISFAEHLLKHAKALKLALTNAYDDSLKYKAKKMLEVILTAHSVLTQSRQYKAEEMYQKEMNHKQKIEKELEKQTRLAQKQLDATQAQIYAQARTQAEIAQLRWENARRAACCK